MRVALLEVSHWHVPLYIDSLKQSEHAVVAVSDKHADSRSKIASHFGCKSYEDYSQLIEREEFDFAFVFGSHLEMPRIAELLIRRRVPFLIEKPCGSTLEQVRRLRVLAEES